jgi:hypothetical protein
VHFKDAVFPALLGEVRFQFASVPKYLVTGAAMDKGLSNGVFGNSQIDGVAVRTFQSLVKALHENPLPRQSAAHCALPIQPRVLQVRIPGLQQGPQ